MPKLDLIGLLLARMIGKNEGDKGGYAGIVVGATALALVSYLAFAALQGEYGLFKLIQVEAQEKRLRAELAELSVQSAAIKDKTVRLSSNTLDIELLDEQARRVLGMSRADEVIFQ